MFWLALYLRKHLDLYEATGLFLYENACSRKSEFADLSASCELLKASESDRLI